LTLDPEDNINKKQDINTANIAEKENNKYKKHKIKNSHFQIMKNQFNTGLNYLIIKN